MADFNDPDVKDFIIEANELLDEAEQLLLNAESRPAKQVHAAVFRVLHSIKGGAGMLDLGEAQNHMHQIESQWNDIHQDDILSSMQCQYFLEAIDSTRRLFHGEIINFNYERLQDQESVIDNGLSASHDELNNKIQPKKSSFHVCIIDDDSDILEIISETLETQGIRTTGFSNPDKGIEFLMNENIDCLITDYKMPQTTGIDVLRQVKQKQPNLPVLLVSGHIDKKVLIDSLTIGGFWAVLEKPFKDTDLIQHTLSAIRYCQTQNALSQSIDLVLYHFSDLEAYLIENDQTLKAQNIRKNLKDMLELRRKLSSKMNI